MSGVSPHVELCPYADRRSSRELYVKLFIVSFNVLQTLFHLLSIRREQGFAVILIFFAITSPITVVAHLLLPLPILAAQYVVYKGDLKLLRRSTAALIGRIPEADEEASEEYWHPSFKGKVSLRALANLGTIAQCIASIYLFSRRAGSGTAALYDHYVYQLAIMGLLASILSLLHLLVQPTFPARARNTNSQQMRWHVIFRKATAEQIAWLVFVELPAIGILSNLVAYYCGLDVWWGSVVFTRTMFDMCIQHALFTFGITLPIVAIYLLARLVMILVFGSDATSLWSELQLGLLVAFATPMVPLSSVFIFGIVDLTISPVIACWHYAMMFWPATASTMGMIVGSSCPEPVDWRRIATFSAVSTQCSCPLALKDAAADWLWALA